MDGKDSTVYNFFHKKIFHFKTYLTILFRIRIFCLNKKHPCHRPRYITNNTPYSILLLFIKSYFTLIFTQRRITSESKKSCLYIIINVAYVSFTTSYYNLIINRHNHH
ncbi:hypothetical protein CPS_2380 [Colwellia psychrerythraea 34H]|uniref:Uncharacterized protein n=1 Tax=Colwellia psychrerythraea (strain 34H / ATCC BAA-681) TaxID=167879 RepID=Q482C0_COLP3|nr:hypothetical protein CPS_2380 [Colwellia psychrerythraea 34H]